MSSPRPDVMSKIQEHAARDPEFRRRLTADPRATLAEALGGPLPADLDIRVVEQTGDTHYLVLPPMEEESVELEDAELAEVAGGHCPWCFSTHGTYCFWTH
jgi:hypothetical protein